MFILMFDKGELFILNMKIKEDFNKFVINF